MAVPKKRTGASAQGHRRSNWKASKPETTKCSNCGELVLTHTVCTACGYYKGKAVSIKSPDYVADDAKKAVKKAPAKKVAAKKAAAKVEETKVEEKVEEVKAVETVEETVETVEAVVETEEVKDAE